jgi:hypothetical protein
LTAALGSATGGTAAFAGAGFSYFFSEILIIFFSSTPSIFHDIFSDVASGADEPMYFSKTSFDTLPLSQETSL